MQILEISSRSVRKNSLELVHEGLAFEKEQLAHRRGWQVVTAKILPGLT